VLAAETGLGFRIDTISRVGYRLVEVAPDGSTTAQSEIPLAAVPQHWTRRHLVGAAAAGVAAIGAIRWLPLPIPQPPSADADQLYRRAIELRGQATLAQAEQSVAYLREAVRADSGSAKAWGALAWGYRSLLEYGARPDSLRIQTMARSAAARSLDLDPANADAHASSLMLRPIYGNWRPIEAGCRRLAASHPGLSIAQYNLALVLCEVGRWRDAVPILSDVAKREPFWPLAHRGLFYSLAGTGRLEEAEHTLDEAIRRWPRRTDFWLARSRLLVTSGRPDAARAFAMDLTSRPVDTGMTETIELIFLEALNGDFEGGHRAAAEQLVAHVGSNASHFVHAAVASTLLGQIGTAFSLLDKFFFGSGQVGAARPELCATAFLFNRWMEPLMRDARFPLLLRRIGLQDYWRLTGTRPDYLHAS
jgi:tetratricopeptide (TPR) repeat protein